METRTLNTAVVVTADAHNPSILHPAFLTAQNVVPAKWEPGEPPLCTPAVSVVKYRNGITFTVEAAKLQVANARPPEEPERDPVFPLAANYVRTLPHVKYTGVGIN